MTKKVSIQGQVASFHALAAQQFFGDDIKLLACHSFSDTFQKLSEGEADFAVCAIENSLYGSINETYDLLVKYHSSIVGEVYLRVKQCLIGLPGTRLSDITEVQSHPVALAQCEQYLSKQLPHAVRFESDDTAGSVEEIKKINDRRFAAIASREAAELHGLEVLAESIETYKQNYTRFIVLQLKPKKILKSNKTSLILKTSHKPGALYEALGAFASLSINLSKLQSRPIVGSNWNYLFYIDVEIGSGPKLDTTLQSLEQQGCEVVKLGSYIHG